MREKFRLNGKLRCGDFVCLVLVCAVLWCGSDCAAVTSKVTRHSTSADMLKGEAEDIVIDSQGTIQLGTAAEVLAEKFEESAENAAWSINTVVASGPTLYIGTSPNGGIYEFSLGKLTRIYPIEEQQQEAEQAITEPADANVPADPNAPTDPNDPNAVKAEEHLTNEHIFAMTTDVAGRLLAGISGKTCGLLRLEDGKMVTLFEPEDAKYIFAITLDDSGNIYLGTGPEGKIYKLDSFGKSASVVYDSLDKNILALAVGEGRSIYAGSDSRGLIYKINPRTQTATVLYDSAQPEITALLFGSDGELYAASTSAKIVETQNKFGAQPSLPGRPEATPKSGKTGTENKPDGGLQLKIANAKKDAGDKSAAKSLPTLKGVKPDQASHIYKVTRDGYVTDIFSQAVVLFAMAENRQKLLVGTGNDAQLFTIDPALEQEAIVYADKQAAQITAIAVADEDVYLGTANPAKLIKLGKTLASEGAYTSALIDAEQPAKWGKLQVEADIPKNTAVLVASRSGNVDDVNDPTFSQWTEPVEITGPTQLRCPLGRFCQYKLVLRSADGLKSPNIREVAVAHTIPNLAPKVESVDISRVEAAGKTGIFKIAYKAKDGNSDKLIYRIDFRKSGRTNWIELKDKVEADSYEWDGKTVEDGRYEIRVTTSDERSNTTVTKLSGSRMSDPVVVDNTGAFVKKYTLERGDKTVTLKVQVADELSVIGKVAYTVDSNEEWTGAIPDDSVFDTTQEDFTIVIEDLEPGEHVISLRVSDDVGNTTYKSFEVTVAGS